MKGTVIVRVPELLEERGLSAADLMYGARLAPGTAYRLASKEQAREITGLTLDVIAAVCYFLKVEVGEVLQYVPDEK